MGFIYALPNALSDKTLESFPDWWPKNQVSLGLDLQGGSQILLQADLNEAIQDRLSSVQDDLRTQLLKGRIAYKNMRSSRSGDQDGEKTSPALTFELRKSDDHEAARKILRNIPGVEFDLKGLRYTVRFQKDELNRLKDNLMARSIEIVSRRINELGTKEPSIQRQGRDRILVQMPGVDDPAHVKAILGKTAKMTFHLVRGNAQSKTAPPGTFIMPVIENGETIEEILLEKRPLLTGENLEDARPDKGEQNDPRISFSFDAAGARKFSEITRKNVGRRFAIVLDDRILVAPVIRGHIPGGRGVIEGRYTFKEVYDTSLLMRSGALPAPLTTLEERTVGPDLGADSIAAGEQATVLAILLVGLIMLVIYGVFGVLANLALLVNLVLLVAALTTIGATLTLSGIAGIALTLGMAVDANVLIFERIKEELAKGSSVKDALKEGFDKAIATILDSNITTLIGGALLFQFGSGSLRGFAVTLSLGILISMFTAISFTRLMVMSYMKRISPNKIPL